MVDAISGTNSYATSAVIADVQAAPPVADQGDGGVPPPSAVFGSSAVAAPPVTGTQPSNAAAQIFQALQGAPSNDAAPSVSRSGAYDIAYRPDSPAADAQGLVARPNVNPAPQSLDLITASNSFAASVQSLQSTNQINHRILDLTT
ncbi:MAG TPA: flagellar basal body rod C-terminal domain-containing protein [Aliidongia sp.]|nr:flagellar basal body rod C-terminal domain-containing protein [Aliidongia sp.]